MKALRFWTICVLLAGTAVFLHLRGSSERRIASEPLADFPIQVATWTGIDQPIDSETLEVLGAGDFLSRIYIQDKMTAPVSLFIGYFPSQRTGSTIHSPKNCLPGSGWVFESSNVAMLPGADGKAHKVGEYIIGNGDNRQFVIYWYQAHGRTVSNEYMAKIYLVSDALRTNRTDGALVRVITPIESNAGVSSARDRAEKFATLLLPTLPRFIPD
jgi:EpsI family protein